jgi:hypothetical protein
VTDVAATLAAWGYPRALDAADLSGLWYELPEGIVWLVWVDGLDHTLAIHGCARPGRRRWLGRDENMTLLVETARELGAKRLYSPLPEIPEAKHLPVRAMRRYFRMRGWEQDALGPFLDL